MKYILSIRLVLIHDKIVSRLVAAGADPLIATSGSQMTPLHLATMGNHCSVIKIIGKFSIRFSITTLEPLVVCIYAIHQGLS